jgi:hypothetical protein
MKSLGALQGEFLESLLREDEAPPRIAIYRRNVLAALSGALLGMSGSAEPPLLSFRPDLAQRGKQRNQREAIHFFLCRFQANRFALIPPLRGRKMPLQSG